MAKDVVKLTTPPFVVAFPEVFKAKAMQNEDGSKGKEKFSLTAIWHPDTFGPKDKERWKAILAALDTECQHRFKMKYDPAKLAEAEVKTGIRSGRAKAAKGLAGFTDTSRFASLTSNYAPGIVALDKSEISLEEGNADEIYPGVVCRATITIYSYDNKGKGLALGLQSLQKIKDGTKLVSRDAANDFGDGDLDEQWLDQAEEALDENVSEIPF